MKTLLWLGGITATLFVLAIVLIKADPQNNIVGVSNGGGRGYSEFVVLMHDRTYEQFLTESGTKTTWRNVGTWTDNTDDIGTALFLSQTGTTLNGKYLDLKNKLFLESAGKGSTTKMPVVMSSSLEPAMSYQPPSERALQEIDALRRKSTPFTKP